MTVVPASAARVPAIVESVSCHAYGEVRCGRPAEPQNTGRLNDLGEIQVRKEELESFSSSVTDVDAHRDALLRINGLVGHETEIPDEDESGALVRCPVR